MIDKLKFNELIFMLDEFLYNKIIDDDLKMDSVLAYKYEILKKIVIINNNYYTQLEYIFNMPISEKTEPFSLKILLWDNEYDIFNMNLEDIRYADFEISYDLFLSEIKDNINYCYYLKEFMAKFIIWQSNTKTSDFYLESEDLYNILLGYYNRNNVEYINNKYVFIKRLAYHC